MKINLLTDAPNHNLALMKISAWHKAQGDSVSLNNGLDHADMTYGSWLYSQKYHADVNGGACFPDVTLSPEIEAMKPDYQLYDLDYSLGYTWHDCPRSCSFCVVPKQPKTNKHQSIWTFHDSRFKKICLLNNNTFSDPQWLETFKEIWDAKLTVRDENGSDLRLLDDEKAQVLKRTKFDSQIHFAWDDVRDEMQIIDGLKLLKEYHIQAMIYVLIGFNSTLEQDLMRCQIINDYKCDPYPMPYNGGTKQDRAFKRFICLRGYRKYKSIKEAWNNYK